MNTPAQGRVAVVTGGANGIGAGVARHLATTGFTVHVLDPGCEVDGRPGTAEPSVGEGICLHPVSVIDAGEVQRVFDELENRRGRVDVVVHAAGTLRLARIADADADDWRSVLESHFVGYLNVLSSALPVMERAGYGRVVGFTSGVGLTRTIIDGPSYGCAKRAIAALTWQLGATPPPGVTINALSPIAATRMVREMLAAGGRNTEGLDLSGMTQVDDVAPTAGFLVDEARGWCSGQVLFSVGSELSVNEPARLIEATRTDGLTDLTGALSRALRKTFLPALQQQRTAGGYHPRLGALVGDRLPTSARRVLLVDENGEPTAPFVDGLRSVGAEVVVESAAADFPAASDVLRRVGDVQAVVVVLRRILDSGSGWQAQIDDHRAVVDHTVAGAGWTRAALCHGSELQRALPVVLVTEGESSAADTAHQMLVQLARASNDTPADVAAPVYTLRAEPGAAFVVGSLAALLIAQPDLAALAGADLTVHDGWVGLRSNPGPVSTVSCGTDAPAGWLDTWLRDATGMA